MHAPALELFGHRIGNREPLFVIAGPCLVEEPELMIEVASTLKRSCDELGLLYIFKTSFDKANRSSGSSPRGPGLDTALRAIETVKRTVGVPVLSDVHEDTPLDEVAAVVDVLQTPSLLVRQTNFIQRVARMGKPMHVKKGQFQAPGDMVHVVEKCHAAGNRQVILCERGVCFGYNTLISDMRGLAIMRRTGCPVVFDATHSVQQPGALGSRSGGQREFVPVLARAAVAAGVAGVFMETHPAPDQAPSDGPNMWPLSRMRELLAVLAELDRTVKKHPWPEDAAV